jgi:hypothetical protein
MLMAVERVPFTGGPANMHILLNWGIILHQNLVSQIHVIVTTLDLPEETFPPFRCSVVSKLLLTRVSSECDLSVRERPAPEFFLEGVPLALVEAREHVENRDDERVRWAE